MPLLKITFALSLIVCTSALKVLIVTHGSSPSGASYIKSWLTPHERIDEADIVVKWYQELDWVNSPPENQYDFIVLGGGGSLDATIQAHEQSWIQSQVNQPFFGICRGMQMICQTFVDTSMTQVNENRESILKNIVVPQLGVSGIIEYSRKWGIRTANLANSQEIEVIDSHVITYNSEAKETAAVVKHKTRPIYGFQGHPEYSGTEPQLAQGILDAYISLYIPEAVVPADTPTGKTDDEIKSGSPPETADQLIENFNQLFDSDPGAAIIYLLDNFAVFFKFW